MQYLPTLFISYTCSDISGPVNSNFVDTMLLTVELSKKIETLSRQVEEACTDKRLKKAHPYFDK